MNLRKFLRRENERREQDKQEAEEKIREKIEDARGDWKWDPKKDPLMTAETRRRLQQMYSTPNDYRSLFSSSTPYLTARNSASIMDAISGLEARWRYDFIEVMPGERIISVMVDGGTDFRSLDIAQAMIQEKSGAFRCSIMKDERIASYAVETPDGRIEVRRFGNRES